MSESSSSPADLLMMLEGPEGPLGESLSKINPTDQLAKEFQPGKFFEVKSFELDFTVSDSSQGGAANKTASRTGKQPNVIVNVAPPSAPGGAHGRGGGGGGVGSSQEFSGWLSTGMTDTLALKVQACKVTRMIDMASPWLFKMCTQKKTFPWARIVARRSGGDVRGTLTFFKLEFKKVILSGLNWAYEDAQVTEQLEFYYRELKVQYAEQTMTGRHESAKSAQWQWTQALSDSGE